MPNSKRKSRVLKCNNCGGANKKECFCSQAKEALTKEQHEAWIQRLVQAELKKSGIEVFYLNRIEDVHGVSGTGAVAVGVQFPSKKCCMEWLSEYKTETIFENIETVEAIHGHEGRTQVVLGLPRTKKNHS